jgi:effector-binding domain-containing protein
LKDLKSITDGTVSIVDYFERSNKRVELSRDLARIHHALYILSLGEKCRTFFSSAPEVTLLPKKAILFTEAWGTTKDIPLYFALIYRYMQQNAIIAVDHSFTWYFKDSTTSKVHMKTCCPVSGFFETGHKEIKCEIFPEMKVARLRHFGDYSTLGETYRMLNEGIEKNEWEKNGEIIETYVITGDTRYYDSSIFVTDIAGVLI